MIHFSPPHAYTNSPIVALDPGSLRLHGNTRLVARQSSTSPRDEENRTRVTTSRTY